MNYTRYYFQCSKLKLVTCEMTIVSTVLSFFFYLCLFLAGNINVYTPSPRTNREKYFHQKYIKRLKCAIWRGKNNFFILFFSHGTRPIHLSTTKWRNLIHKNWTSKCFCPPRHFISIVKKVYSIYGKTLKKFLIRKKGKKKNNKLHDFIMKNKKNWSSSSCTFHHQIA